MGFPVPNDPATLASATWPEVEALYAPLRSADLTRENVREWLSAWSALDTAIEEAYSTALIDYTADTRDAEREAAYLRWASDIGPKLHEIHVDLGKKLLPVGDAVPELAIMLRQIDTDVRLFRQENIPRYAALQEMEAHYDKVTGGLTVEWEGERITVPALQPHAQDPDRAVRERAFRAGADAYLAHHEELAQLYDRMVALRHEIATAAGFANYRDFVFPAKHRFDYTPDDCRRFHEAVEATVLPAVARLREHRRRALGVDTLRPWDLAINTERAERLVPFGTVAEFITGGERVFDAVDPGLGAQFRTMVAERVLDLESREGKAPGGYCTRLPYRGLPFIFMNAVGVHDDVSTLVHEAGHAFHTFATRGIGYLWQRDTGHEAAELASMSMELLAAPYLAKPTGYYSPDDAADAEIEHLEDLLVGLPHIACVDAFQHWVYTDGLHATPAERDAEWLRIRARFEPEVDWSGLERERIARWYRQSHIHTAPFYYIEYGIAQLGALQVWRRAQADPAGALARYKAALALGGTVSLPKMYAAAGVKLEFSAEGMRPLVEAVEVRIAELRARRPAA